MEPAIGPGGPVMRVLGAGLAAAISFSVAVGVAAFAEAGALSGVVDGGVLAIIALGAAIGVPVGSLLGWLYTPAALNGRGTRLQLVVSLATRAVPLGAALVAFTLTFDDLVRGGPGVAGLVEAVASGAMLILVGLMYFGLPAWALAAIVCALWVMVLGAAAGNGHSDNAQTVLSVER